MRCVTLCFHFLFCPQLSFCVPLLIRRWLRYWIIHAFMPSFTSPCSRRRTASSWTWRESIALTTSKEWLTSWKRGKQGCGPFKDSRWWILSVACCCLEWPYSNAHVHLQSIHPLSIPLRIMLSNDLSYSFVWVCTCMNVSLKTFLWSSMNLTFTWTHTYMLLCFSPFSFSVMYSSTSARTPVDQCTRVWIRSLEANVYRAACTLELIKVHPSEWDSFSQMCTVCTVYALELVLVWFLMTIHMAQVCLKRISL